MSRDLTKASNGAIREIEPGTPGFPPVARLEKLWVRGRWPLPAGPKVALVGARSATVGGMEQAAALAEGLTRAGVLVLSGGAVGIDRAAHVGAMRAGTTAAVLAPGLDNPFPEQHHELYQDIVAGGGTLVSREAPGTQVRSFQFPLRNAVLAALCDMVVLVECQVKSGSMSTARAAAQHKRLVGACPGSPGTERVIQSGAALVRGVDDVLAALRGEARRPELVAPEAGSVEARVLAALEPGVPRGAEFLAGAAAVDVLAAARALTSLELAGWAVSAPGGRYARAAHAAQIDR